MTPFFGLPLRLLCLLLQATTAGGTLVNRTIDDQGGDNVTGALPTYLPSTWNDGQTCFGCHLHPGIIEPSQAFNRTWSDNTYRVGSPALVVQVGFTGSAVYVYNIVVDSIVADTDTLVNLTFFLDDEAVGAYYHEPISDPPGSVPQVSYHVLVYSNSSLPHGEHALQMVSSGSKSTNVLFDYVVYTTEDDPQPQAAQSSPTTQSPETAAVSSDLPRSTSTHPAPSASDTAQSSSSQHAHTINTAAIVGAVVGGIGLILLVLLSFLLIRRHCISRKGRGRIRSPSGFLRSARYSSSSYATVAPYNVIALAPSREARKLALEQHGGTSPSGSPPAIQNTPSVPTADAVGAENERIARLVQQIQTLQAQVRELRASRSTADRRPSDAEQSLSSLLAALRNEVSGLRAELGEQQLVAYSGPQEGPPSYRG